MARNGGTMPSERLPFTPSSILFRPHHKPAYRCGGLVVEAPGTAPGSERLITISIYRHSWRTSSP